MKQQQPKDHGWRIKRKYYDLIFAGIKTLEVRVGYPDVKKVKKGDTITFKDHSNVKFEVVRVTCYKDFPEMLDSEDSNKAIPGVTKYKALEMYQAIYPEDKEALGVYVFELRKQGNDVKSKKPGNDVKIHKLSILTANRSSFGKYAHAAYVVTDYICKDYPKHFEWYWAKQIPRVFDGTGEVIVCTVGPDIAGVAFLKKDSNEKKICTFLVLEKYRGMHIATKMLEEAFKFLETTKPLITLADYKLPMFKHIIEKYGWELTQTMEAGYYNNSSSELVYNGTLPE
jgi:ASC-1-like (ASCH) protein